MKDRTIKKIMHPEIIELGKTEEKDSERIIQLQEFKAKKLQDPISTGFEGLDKLTMGGLRGGDLVIVSGQSGRGKTLFSLQLIKNFSNLGEPSLFISFEEPMDRIRFRMDKMGATGGLLCFSPKKLPTGQIEWLEAKIKSGLAHHFIEIVIIDNLDFITAPKDSTEDKWVMQSKIIALLKRLAIEYGLIIILNAHIKKVDDSTPRMEDLYGSGDIYKLSDYVWFVHRLRQKKTREQAKAGEIPEFTNSTDIIVEKNRLTGALGTIHLILGEDNNLHEL